MILFVFLINVIITNHFVLGQTMNFMIRTNVVGPSIQNEFLSFALDAYLPHHWNAFDFDSPLINTLAQGLSPVYLRYSGNDADQTYYDTSSNITNIVNNKYQHGGGNYTQTLNMTQFSILTNFARINNWKFIFGLNAQDRFDHNNSWDPTNSIQLIDQIIEYYQNNDQHNIVYAFELGNEPNNYNNSKMQSDNFTVVTSQQMAKDFNTLYDIIHTKFSNIPSLKPKIFGCDATHKGMHYLQTFMQNIGNQKILDTMTWHHYFGDGSTATLSDFIDIQLMDTLIPFINQSLSIAISYSKPVYIGESGTFYNDFSNTLASSFAAGFMYLDKLGLSSIMGISSVIRQAFWGGANGIINV
eukprot:157131_1